MIACCADCGSLWETTEEDAFTPGTLCPPCHRRRTEAVVRDGAHAAREALARVRRDDKFKKVVGETGRNNADLFRRLAK